MGSGSNLQMTENTSIPASFGMDALINGSAIGAKIVKDSNGAITGTDSQIVEASDISLRAAAQMSALLNDDTILEAYLSKKLSINFLDKLGNLFTDNTTSAYSTIFRKSLAKAIAEVSDYHWKDLRNGLNELYENLSIKAEEAYSKMLQYRVAHSSLSLPGFTPVSADSVVPFIRSVTSSPVSVNVLPAIAGSTSSIPAIMSAAFSQASSANAQMPVRVSSASSSSISFAIGSASPTISMVGDGYVTPSSLDVVWKSAPARYYSSVPSVQSSVSHITDPSPSSVVNAMSSFANTAITTARGAISSLARGLRAAFTNRLEYAVAMAEAGVISDMTPIVADAYKQAEEIKSKNAATKATLEQERLFKQEEVYIQHVNGYADYGKSVMNAELSSKSDSARLKEEWNKDVLSAASIHINAFSEVDRFALSLFEALVRSVHVLNAENLASVVGAYFEYDYKLRALQASSLFQAVDSNMRSEGMALAAYQEKTNADWLDTMKVINVFRDGIAAYAAAPVPTIHTRPTPFGNLMNAASGILGAAAQVAQIAAIL